MSYTGPHSDGNELPRVRRRNAIRRLGSSVTGLGGARTYRPVTLTRKPGPSSVLLGGSSQGQLQFGDPTRDNYKVAGVSGCTVKAAPPRISLNGRRILLATAACAVLAVLCVAHIHLRFTIHDLRVQTQRLQSGKRELMMQVDSLERENARLTDLGRLRDYAREKLKMVDSGVEHQNVVQIPAALKKKYHSLPGGQGPDAPSGYASLAFGKRVKSVEEARSTLMSLVDVGWAFAKSRTR